jgi:uncharacterized protein (TIGR02147 family)
VGVAQNQNIKKPSVFRYQNYRKFLQDLYSYFSKRNINRLSYRSIAQRAGIQSHNFLRQVIRGESNLSEESISKFAKAFELNVEETKFFKNLVLFNQAKDPSQKEFHAAQVIKSKGFRKIQPLGKEKLNFYSKWYMSIIYLLCDDPGFSVEAASQSLIPPVKVEKIQRALVDLEKLGMIQREQVPGSQEVKWKKSSKPISTGDEVFSPVVANFHQIMLSKAGESINKVSREERDISSLTLSLTDEEYKSFKKQVSEFRKNLLMQFSNGPEKRRVFQFNFQLFPLTKQAMQESE